MAERIRKGDKVKIIAGDNKGSTSVVSAVLPRRQAALLEGIGTKTRQVKPSRLNPMGGSKSVHTPVLLSKLAVVIDAKSSKTSRIGYSNNSENVKMRVARQDNNKEIK